MYDIHAIIIDYLIMKYYVDDSITTTAAITELKFINDYKYSLQICNTKHIEMVLRYISSGLSFKQATLSTYSARLVVGAADFRGFIEIFVRISVRSTVAINLQHLRGLIVSNFGCSYSIAFDTATNRGDE